MFKRSASAPDLLTVGCSIAVVRLQRSSCRQSVVVCVPVCVLATSMLNISDNKQVKGSCPIKSLQKSAYGTSISDIIDDATRL